MTKEKEYAFVNYYVDCDWYGCNYDVAVRQVEKFSEKVGLDYYIGVQEVWGDEDGNEIDGSLDNSKLCYHWIEDKNGKRIPLEN